MCCIQAVHEENRDLSLSLFTPYLSLHLSIPSLRPCAKGELNKTITHEDSLRRPAA